jgi:hypothetical protein
MAEQTWFKTVGTRLKVKSARNETRPVHVVISVDSSDDDGKERPIRERKLCAEDIVMLALPDFRPEPYSSAFQLEKIEKPDDDKLIELTGVPTFRDGKIYELRN